MGGRRQAGRRGCGGNGGPATGFLPCVGGYVALIQRIFLPYAAKRSSTVSSVSDSHCAWAINIRSKGSRWCMGKSAVAFACAREIGNHWNSEPSTAASKCADTSSFPSFCLIRISQAEAALKKTVRAGSAINARIGRGSRGESSSHQSRTCVSRSSFIPPRRIPRYRQEARQSRRRSKSGLSGHRDGGVRQHPGSGRGERPVSLLCR